MKTALTTLLATTALASVSSAVVIGIETFDTDGAIAGQTGGSGFNYDNFDGAVTTTTSDWDNTGGAPTVSGGVLVTNGTSAKREFNGNIEGAGNSGNDGQDDHERSGGFRGAGIVFFQFDITRSTGSTWSGLSSYDFGAERIFFGVNGANGATDLASIQLSGGVGAVGGVSSATSSIALVDGQTHTLVAALDFDNDLVGLYVDPDTTDEWTSVGGTADVTLGYTGSNWSTAARFGSGGTDSTTWDNLTIATTGAEVGLLGIPEPSSALLGAIGLLTILRRRR